MAYIQNLKDGLQLLLYKDIAIDAIKNDENATLYAIYTVLLSSVASLFGVLTWYIAFIVPIIFLFKTIVMHVIAKVFGGKASLEDFFRPMGATHIAYWVTAIPLLGFVLRPFIFLYLIPLEVKIVKNTHKLSLERSIIVVALPFILLVIKVAVLSIYLVSFIIDLIPFM